MSASAIDAAVTTIAALISIPLKHPEEIQQLHTLRDILEGVVGGDDPQEAALMTMRHILTEAIGQANAARQIKLMRDADDQNGKGHERESRFNRAESLREAKE